MRLTVKDAGRVLCEAGITFKTYGELREVRDKAFNPVIKCACDKLLTFILWGEKGRKYAHK